MSNYAEVFEVVNEIGMCQANGDLIYGDVARQQLRAHLFSQGMSWDEIDGLFDQAAMEWCQMKSEMEEL